MTEKIDEIQKRIRDHEKRISELEKATFVEKVTPKKEQEFKGLSGGIQFLISKGFLDTPKSVKEIQEELRKEGYHYPYESIGKLLSVDFMSKRKILTRVKENNVWKYVIRK
jgi:hypothetical protein